MRFSVLTNHIKVNELMVLFSLASLNTMEVGSSSQHLFKEYLETANEAATENSLEK